MQNQASRTTQQDQLTKHINWQDNFCRLASWLVIGPCHCSRFAVNKPCKEWSLSQCETRKRVRVKCQTKTDNNNIKNKLREQHLPRWDMSALSGDLVNPCSVCCSWPPWPRDLDRADWFTKQGGGGWQTRCMRDDTLKNQPSDYNILSHELKFARSELIPMGEPEVWLSQTSEFSYHSLDSVKFIGFSYGRP